MLRLLELVIYVVLVALVATQLVWPLWHGEPLFPFLRRKAVSIRLTEAREALVQARVDEQARAVEHETRRHRLHVVKDADIQTPSVDDPPSSPKE